MDKKNILQLSYLIVSIKVIRRLPGGIQFSSVAQLCPTLCNPMDCSMPGFPVNHRGQGSSGKEFSCQCKSCKWCGFDPWVRKILWSRKRQSTPVFLPRKLYGQRSLVGYSPWGCKESDMSEHTHTEKVISTKAESPLPAEKFKVTLKFSTMFNWATMFCLICLIHLTSCQVTIIFLSISTSFCSENTSTSNKRLKMLSKSSLNPKAQMFMLQE